MKYKFTSDEIILSPLLSKVVFKKEDITDVFEFIAAQIEELSNGFGICLFSGADGKREIAGEHNGRMSDQRIITLRLEFFRQTQMRLGYFEKTLDLPAFAVQVHDFFVWHSQIGG